MADTVLTCPRCGGCVACGHATNCPDPSIEISGYPSKSQCAILAADMRDREASTRGRN